MSGLSLTTPRQADELLTSHVSRLARLHGSYSAAAFSGNIGLNFQSLLSGDPQHVSRYAQLTNSTETEIEDGVIKTFGQRYRYARGHSFSRSHLLATRTKFCPQCMIADEQSKPGRSGSRAYIRSTWQPRFFRVCDVHNATMVTSTPGGLKFVGDVLGGLESVGETLENYTGHSVTGETTTAQAYFASRFNRQPTDVQWLNRLPLQSAAHFAEMLGAVKRHGIKVQFEELDTLEQSRSMQEGYELTLRGQQAIKAFLVALVKDFYCRPKSPLNAHAVFGELADEMCRHSDMPGYSQVIRLLQSVAVQNLPIGRGDDFLGVVKTPRRLHSIQTASEEHGISRFILKSLMVEHGLIPPASAFNSTVFHPSVINDLVEPARRLGTGLKIKRRPKNR